MRRNIRDVYLYNTIGRIFLEELINHPQLIITSLSFLYKIFEYYISRWNKLDEYLFIKTFVEIITMQIEGWLYLNNSFRAYS